MTCISYMSLVQPLHKLELGPTTILILKFSGFASSLHHQGPPPFEESLIETSSFCFKTALLTTFVISFCFTRQTTYFFYVPCRRSVFLMFRQPDPWLLCFQRRTLVQCCRSFGIHFLSSRELVSFLETLVQPLPSRELIPLLEMTITYSYSRGMIPFHRAGFFIALLAADSLFEVPLQSRGLFCPRDTFILEEIILSSRIYLETW